VVPLRTNTYNWSAAAATTLPELDNATIFTLPAMGFDIAAGESNSTLPLCASKMVTKPMSCSGRPWVKCPPAAATFPSPETPAANTPSHPLNVLAHSRVPVES
jgi:hypothetical protein